MAKTLERCVRQLRNQSQRTDRATATDCTLLKAFADTHDEAAFAELMRRHGEMVFSVCRRVLGNVQDAEDAFQATFLVLARKAGTVAWHDGVKNWLYGVACRVAMKARGRMHRRRERELAADASEPTAKPSPQCDELRSQLDEAMLSLPDRYRSVLLLCCLQGKTRDEAAEELGWSLGSVKGCLERAREMLRDRLARRGIALGTALTLGLVSSANAAPPQALLGATLQSALGFTAGVGGTITVAAPVSSLAIGVMNAMMLAKIKTATLGFAFALIAAAVVTVAGTSFDGRVAASHEPAAAVDAQDREKKDAPAKRDENAKKDDPNRRRDGEKGRAGGVLGIVKEIDLKVGTITIRFLQDGQNGDGMFSIGDKNLKPTTSTGKALALADVTPGTRVVITTKDQDVTAIRVENPVFFSFIANVDVRNNTVQFRMENLSQKLPVAEDATLSVLGRSVKLAEVPAGERGAITLSLDKKTIIGIDIARARPKVAEREGGAPREGGPPREGDPNREAVRVPASNGTIVEIDKEKQTLSVLVSRDGDLKLQTIAIAKESKLTLNFDERVIRELTFAELTKPLQVNVQLAEDGRTVKSLIAVAPVMRGGFKSYDAATKKLTLLTEGRMEKEYDVDAEPIVANVGRAGAKLADLVPGTSVIVTFNLDRTRVIGITGLARRVDGER